MHSTVKILASLPVHVSQISTRRMILVSWDVCLLWYWMLVSGNKLGVIRWCYRFLRGRWSSYKGHLLTEWSVSVCTDQCSKWPVFGLMLVSVTIDINIWLVDAARTFTSAIQQCSLSNMYISFTLQIKLNICSLDFPALKYQGLSNDTVIIALECSLKKYFNNHHID